MGRNEARQRKEAPKMRIIVPTIQKGGNSKTTSAATLAQAAVYRGFKALAVDLDPQAQLSFTVKADTAKPGAYELLEGTPARKLIQGTPSGLDVIPASWSLTTLTSGQGSARRLSAALEPIRRRYDFIIIDTPSAGEMQYNALQAATDLIIPLQADIYNLQSLYQITDLAHQIQRTNPALSLTGIFFTDPAADARSALARAMKQTIIEKAAEMGLPYLGTIRRGVAIKEAASFQKSIFTYAPRAKPAQDYLQLFDRIAINGERG